MSSSTFLLCKPRRHLLGLACLSITRVKKKKFWVFKKNCWKRDAGGWKMKFRIEGTPKEDDPTGPEQLKLRLWREGDPGRSKLTAEGGRKDEGGERRREEVKGGGRVQKE
jgi:hypothetical protein